MKTVRVTLIVIAVVVAVVVGGCATVRAVSAQAAIPPNSSNVGVGGWSQWRHYSNEYQATENGYPMACRTGEISVHKWTWLGDSFQWHLWSTACFRLHWPTPQRGYPYFAYVHMTPTWSVCDLFCSMDSPNFSTSHYGCTGAYRCLMTGVRDVSKISENYDSPIGGIHQQYYPWAKMIWRIVKWAPGRGQIGVTGYDGCAGC